MANISLLAIFKRCSMGNNPVKINCFHLLHFYTNIQLKKISWNKINNWLGASYSVGCGWWWVFLLSINISLCWSKWVIFLQQVFGVVLRLYIFIFPLPLAFFWRDTMFVIGILFLNLNVAITVCRIIILVKVNYLYFFLLIIFNIHWDDMIEMSIRLSKNNKC